MLLRSLLAFVVGAAILFGWTLWAEYAPRKVAFWQGTIIVVAMILLYVGAAILGIAAFAAVAPPIIGWRLGDWTPLAYVPAPLIGVWAASITLQVLINLARRVQGKPAHKIEWWRKPGRKRRKKAAGPGPVAH